MITAKDSQLGKKLREYLHGRIQKIAEDMSNGMEFGPYQKAVAKIEGYRETLREIEAVEKELREDR